MGHGQKKTNKKTNMRTTKKGNPPVARGSNNKNSSEELLKFRSLVRLTPLTTPTRPTLFAYR